MDECSAVHQGFLVFLVDHCPKQADIRVLIVFAVAQRREYVE